MAIAYNPKIVTDGLVLCLDAANQKSFLSSVDVLVVGGGGAGGGGVRFSGGGGGGGGGAVVSETTSLLSLPSFTVTVGAGGTANGNTTGTNGGSSSFNGVVAPGGGGGGRAGGGSGTNTGLNGSSGGGGGGTTPGNTAGFGLGTAGLGNDGAPGAIGGSYDGGGGGGAGAAGRAPTSDSGGGDGISSNFTGTTAYYGGGGAGGTYVRTGIRPGGLGGGGNSGLTNGSPGTPNTGGGGGASGIDSNSVTVFVPGSGGSGIVVIRYPGPQRATGGTVTSVNGDTVHTFTASGTFTPNIMTNLSGNGNNGTLVNGVGYNSSDQGSLVFDGVDDYVSISQVGNTSSFSYEVFLKPTQVTKDQMYIGYSPISSAYVRITSSKAYLSVSAGGQRILSHSETLVNNQIYHIVSIYNGVQLKIYVNNNLTVGAVINQTLAGWGTDRIGRWRDADQRSFVGNIYSLRIYNRELSAQEIKQNFNAARGRFGI